MNPNTIKTLPGFVRFFEAIPARKWCINYFQDGTGRCCARGHLGVTEDNQGDVPADNLLLRLAPSVALVNNGYGICKGSPKSRVLSYLRGLLRRQ